MRCIVCDLCDLVIDDINYKLQILCKLRILFRSQ